MVEIFDMAKVEKHANNRRERLKRAKYLLEVEAFEYIPEPIRDGGNRFFPNLAKHWYCPFDELVLDVDSFDIGPGLKAIWHFKCTKCTYEFAYYGAPQGG